MSGLHASVPEHVLSAIGELEHAFRTNKNTRLTIEDATVRVQNGAMQYMLGQARRLHFFSPVHLLVPRYAHALAHHRCKRAFPEQRLDFARDARRGRLLGDSALLS